MRYVVIILSLAVNFVGFTKNTTGTNYGAKVLDEAYQNYHQFMTLASEGDPKGQLMSPATITKFVKASEKICGAYDYPRQKPVTSLKKQCKDTIATFADYPYSARASGSMNDLFNNTIIYIVAFSGEHTKIPELNTIYDHCMKERLQIVSHVNSVEDTLDHLVAERFFKGTKDEWNRRLNADLAGQVKK